MVLCFLFQICQLQVPTFQVMFLTSSVVNSCLHDLMGNEVDEKDKLKTFIVT